MGQWRLSLELSYERLAVENALAQETLELTGLVEELKPAEEAVEEAPVVARPARPLRALRRVESECEGHLRALKKERKGS